MSLKSKADKGKIKELFKSWKINIISYLICKRYKNKISRNFWRKFIGKMCQGKIPSSLMKRKSIIKSLRLFQTK